MSERKDGWLRAIDEALVTTHMGVADSDDSYEAAKRKLGELIDWHVSVATDSRVNGGWQLVPVEPTFDMMQSGYWSGSGDVSVNEGWARREVWRRMLSSAPKP